MPPNSTQKPIFITTINDVGQRVDNYILKHCKDLNKASCYKLIRKGQVRINGKRIKAMHKLQVGDQIRVPPYLFFTEKKSAAVPIQLQEQLQQHVIFEDDDYLVLNKPAGLPCHTGTGHELGVIEIITSMEGYANTQLAHRLDKDTSGCLVLAKCKHSLLQFQKALQERKMKKTYVAMLSGVLSKLTEVNQPLNSKNRINGFRRVLVSQSGQPAHTIFTPLKNNGENTLTQCEITTGRTHQIRVHAQFIGHAVVGDRFYGKAEPSADRALYLHAHKIVFHGYQFSSDIPESFRV